MPTIWGPDAPRAGGVLIGHRKVGSARTSLLPRPRWATHARGQSRGMLGESERGTTSGVFLNSGTASASNGNSPVDAGGLSLKEKLATLSITERVFIHS